MPPTSLTAATSSEAYAAPPTATAIAGSETTNTNPTKKLRSACDACHEVKLKCLGGQPCSRCRNKQIECVYRHAARIGKPKGSRNKKTIERLKQAQAQAGSEQAELNASEVSDAIRVAETRPYCDSTRPCADLETQSPEDGVEELDEDDNDEGTNSSTHRNLSDASRNAFLSDKHPLGGPYDDNLNDLHNISTTRNDVMDMLGQSHILDDAHHELEIPTTGISPDGLNNLRPLSASAGNPSFWMPSPTKSLNGTTFSAMGGNLQDSFLTSSWRSTYGQSSLRPTFQFPRLNQVEDDSMGLDTSSGAELDGAFNDQLLSLARGGSISSADLSNSTKEGNSILSSAHSHMTGIYTSANRRQSCACLKVQADALCRIHLMNRSQADMRGDTVLATASQILDSCNALILCQCCVTDYKFLLLAIMTMRILFCWLRGLSMARTHTDHPNMRLTLGEYEISGEEEAIIKNMLVLRALEKGKMALRRIRERVTSVTAQGAGSCGESAHRWDLTYIRMCLDHLEKDIGY